MTSIHSFTIEQKNTNPENIEHVNKLSEKLKIFLEKRYIKSQKKIKKLKRRKLILRVLIISFAGASIVISVVLAGTASLMLAPIIVAILTIISGAFTSISLNFNLKSKETKLNNELNLLHALESKLDYIISCNGDLTENDYNKIINDTLALSSS